MKYAYDAIADQYNQLKTTDMGDKLAQTAMYVTYCLTIDKLYIKGHIADNFKSYFEWIKQPTSNYVPLNTFKKYLDEAPKEVLIEHSRFVLKKYYNIWMIMHSLLFINPTISPFMFQFISIDLLINLCCDWCVARCYGTQGRSIY